ncbi:hypothetical protein Asal01_00977 [Fodinibius salicampi]
MKYGRRSGLIKNYIYFNTILCVILIAASCATPSSPTGGPRDEEGPSIIRTEPETGTTNFGERSITLHFSEFVERSSLTQAIVVEPDIGIDYELDWGRKSVEIEFSSAIPDSTTLIVTIDTELRDTNGNEMSSPYKVAVSTGDEIDEGKLFGRIVDARTGEGSEEGRLLLYREPIDLSAKADYVASPDTGGVFQFSYLSDGKYKVFWMADRNRNKIWDREQERAQPFQKEFVTLEKAAEDTIGTVFVTLSDTTRPVLQGVGLFSSQRMRMRFSENIEITNNSEINVTDSTGNVLLDANPLYIPPGEKYVLFAQAEEPLAESDTYSLSINGITDQSGNELTEISQTFSGSAQEDTTQQRIITRNNLSGYYPSDPVEVTYAKPIDEPEIRDSLKVVEGTEMHDSWPNVDIQLNMLRISPDSVWEDGVDYELRIWDPIIEDYRKLQPEVWYQSQMGQLNIIAEDSTLSDIRLRISNEEAGIQRDTVFSQQVEIEALPPLSYRVRAYHDVNNNGQWDYGSVEPFEEPEPYFIQGQVPVKEGFTGDLTISFQQ